MKTFQKMFVFAIVLLSATTIWAASAVPTIRIEKSGSDKKISVVVERLKSNAVVQITTVAGVVLEEEKALPGAYARIFNVENLERGSYRVVVATELTEVVQPFAIQADELTLNPQARESYFAPALKWQGELLDLTMYNNRLTDVHVTVLDKQGNVVFQDNVRKVVKVERRYNLNDLGRGDYVVEVSTPHRSYYKNITVK
ncbi:MAG TPA: hypothetical protein PKC76_14765 [Saprospiraceae bacterium]|nr:hypothetical protein [Saprospiraceae bacterium]HMP25394.1 hypothetical protein [Saprospiraceae bacterium]